MNKTRGADRRTPAKWAPNERRSDETSPWSSTLRREVGCRPPVSVVSVQRMQLREAPDMVASLAIEPIESSTISAAHHRSSEADRVAADVDASWTHSGYALTPLELAAAQAAATARRKAAAKLRSSGTDTARSHGRTPGAAPTVWSPRRTWRGPLQEENRETQTIGFTTPSTTADSQQQLSLSSAYVNVDASIVSVALRRAALMKTVSRVDRLALLEKELLPAADTGDDDGGGVHTTGTAPVVAGTSSSVETSSGGPTPLPEVVVTRDDTPAATFASQLPPPPGVIVQHRRGPSSASVVRVTAPSITSSEPTVATSRVAGPSRAAHPSRGSSAPDGDALKSLIDELEVLVTPAPSAAASVAADDEQPVRHFRSGTAAVNVSSGHLRHGSSKLDSMPSISALQSRRASTASVVFHTPLRSAAEAATQTAVPQRSRDPSRPPSPPGGGATPPRRTSSVASWVANEASVSRPPPPEAFGPHAADSSTVAAAGSPLTTTAAVLGPSVAAGSSHAARGASMRERHDLPVWSLSVDSDDDLRTMLFATNASPYVGPTASLPALHVDEVSSRREKEVEDTIRPVIDRIAELRRQIAQRQQLSPPRRSAIEPSVMTTASPPPHLGAMQLARLTRDRPENSSTLNAAPPAPAGYASHARAFFALRDQFFASRDHHRTQRVAAVTTATGTVPPEHH